MKRFAVVLSGLSEDPEIKFYMAEDWRDAALKAAQVQSAEFPLWNCLDVPDEAMDEEGDEEQDEPQMVPLMLHEALQDATNADMLFAVVEVPA